MEIASDNRAGEILDNLVAALNGATLVGNKVFASAKVVNDIESFVRVSDPLAEPAGVAIGIVAGTIEEAAATTDDEVAFDRLPLTIIIRMSRIRQPGGDEFDPVKETQRWAEVVKYVVTRDRSRGGKANLIEWSGRVLNGTEVTGNVRPLTKFANEAFFSAALPVACGWRILAR
jgi:hypothetical protein